MTKQPWGSRDNCITWEDNFSTITSFCSEVLSSNSCKMKVCPNLCMDNSTISGRATPHIIAWTSLGAPGKWALRNFEPCSSLATASRQDTTSYRDTSDG